MKVERITVGLTYNMGNFESKKGEVTIKVKPYDSRETARNYAVEQCAAIISGENPEVYQDCIKKLSGEVNPETVKRLFKQQKDIQRRVDNLKSELTTSTTWLKALNSFDENQDKWDKLINIPEFWVKLNQLLLEFNASISSSENSEESQEDDDSFDDPHEFIEM